MKFSFLKRFLLSNLLPQKRESLKLESFKKTEYSVKIGNGKTHHSFMSNMKGGIVISTQIVGLLSFINTSSEGSVITLYFLGIW